MSRVCLNLSQLEPRPKSNQIAEHISNSRFICSRACSTLLKCTARNSWSVLDTHDGVRGQNAQLPAVGAASSFLCHSTKFAVAHRLWCPTGQLAFGMPIVNVLAFPLCIHTAHWLCFPLGACAKHFNTGYWQSAVTCIVGCGTLGACLCAPPGPVHCRVCSFGAADAASTMAV